MTLSDVQIDRFSRQIIVPQIGARGQQRLLQSSVALAGSGALAEHAALYLTGAGIGRLALHAPDGAALRAALVDLNPEAEVVLAREPFGAVAADVLVACNAGIAELDRAATRRPLIVGQANRARGWLVVSRDAAACARCAVRAWPRADAADRGGPSPAAGVIGSLVSLAALKLLLGIGDPARREWVEFDAARSIMSAHPITRAADCPACAGATR
jgi:molybdopterin/thiamine biosynthesis adenylyltransferase